MCICWSWYLNIQSKAQSSVWNGKSFIILITVTLSWLGRPSTQNVNNKLGGTLSYKHHLLSNNIQNCRTYVDIHTLVVKQKGNIQFKRTGNSYRNRACVTSFFFSLCFFFSFLDNHDVVTIYHLFLLQMSKDVGRKINKYLCRYDPQTDINLRHWCNTAVTFSLYYNKQINNHQKF